MAAATIYPGEIIREPMIADADFPDALASAAYATSRAQLIGKVARRTLLPGQAIPTNAVGEPKLVTIGATVRVVYKEDGLTIATYAAALQAGAAGDVGYSRLCGERCRLAQVPPSAASCSDWTKFWRTRRAATGSPARRSPERHGADRFSRITAPKESV